MIGKPEAATSMSIRMIRMNLVATLYAIHASLHASLLAMPSDTQPQ